MKAKKTWLVLPSEVAGAVKLPSEAGWWGFSASSSKAGAWRWSGFLAECGKTKALLQTYNSLDQLESKEPLPFILPHMQTLQVLSSVPVPHVICCDQRRVCRNDKMACHET